ncbi:MAG: hypothetical protein AWT59_1222 [Candidatus Gallionella acididurans]|uniref:Secreted protein n=1 Tax=Candidatus Gallionella acididurans TaxID=1796491 RepID=A0A139BUG8_9PROT|nr:MAG: hypothetical protein AWT59_1222 [Candidatus Gallionella acididurans]
MLKATVFIWLSIVIGTAHAAPQLTLGASDNYCVVTCYVRIPFTITGYESTRNIGMVYCDVDVELKSIMAAYDGHVGSRDLRQSPIGVFKNTPGTITGEVQVDTGISKKNFLDARVKTATCHL